MNRDDLAARLSEHGTVRLRQKSTTNDGRIRNEPQCECGAWVEDFITHLADVALAWFQEQTTEEALIQIWEPYEDEDGVQHDGKWHVAGTTGRNYKAKRPEASVEFRRATAWEEAK